MTSLHEDDPRLTVAVDGGLVRGRLDRTREVRAFLAAETKKWAEVVKAGHITLQ